MAQKGPSSGTAGTRTGVDACNSQGCRCCGHIWKGAVKFQSTATREHYNITQYLTCKTPSVIYIIQCKKCPVQYVGKTSTTLQRTVEEHRASITNQQRQPVPDHFNNNDHCLDHLIVYPIEQVNGSEALKERELYWIRELATMAHGLNLMPNICEKHRTEETAPETAPMAQAGPSSGTAGTRTGVDTCNSQGCLCCRQITKGTDKFQSTATGKQYNITQHLTCKTPSVIYIIQCKKCPVQYVGKTATTLQRRFTDHRSSIRYRQHRPISDHFNNHDHSLEDLILFPIEQVNGSEALKEREFYWIRELETMAHGLNLVPLGEQPLDDGEARSEGPADRQGEESMEFPQKGKRKLGGNGDRKSKRRKLKNKGQSVFSYEMEEIVSTCEDALEDGKQTISEVYAKLKDVSCREKQSMRFLEDLKKKISYLKENVQKEKIYIGLFGKTGAGKSSLINALVNENQLLPSGSMQACTSVFVHVQANTDSSKYKADIEFISPEDWKSELQFLVELLEKENDQQKTAEDDGMVEMAREKIKAIYGEEGLKKSYSELVGAKEFPEIPNTCRKTMNLDTAQELSRSIGCYIRSDKKTEQQFWPLVKRVTISLPQSPAILEGIVLVDLPGAGDVSKNRSEMWKECLSQCSSVWIVNEMNRALSEKVSDEIFDESLRHVAGGGECHNITFICTKTDIINPEEIKENYHITDEDLEIELDTQDPHYERREKQACILFRNERFKVEISAHLKEKTKKFLLGDEGDSDGFFDVYTVSSEEFRRIAQRKSTVLDCNETELPLLMEHIKKLYVSHSMKKVKDYVSEVSGIISYLHFSKDALSSKAQTSNSQEFSRLEKDLDKTCTTLNSVLSRAHTKLQEGLVMGAKEAEKHCLTNAKERVLEPRWCDNRGHHKTLKALCKNDGYYRSGNGVVVDLNYTLSQPMYKQMNGIFLTTFGPGGTRASINGQFASFQENFIKGDLLKYNRTKNKEKYLRLVYIRTEQRKLHKNLEKQILKRKKLIYNSLSDSICDTMMPTYQECAAIHGKDVLMKLQEKLQSAITKSKNYMFRESMKKMLVEFSDLQKYLVAEIKTQMTTSLRLALNQIPDDITGLPEVSEEMKTMERSCEALGLQLF
ncbi:nuclear GTPase SLIP-GC-like isoform X3 [Anguilla anguilla]|uniref:nuclear GTPase SLIP-GC-like isoform X3 n=1 Tax=Anguilla anguilla TaxID=7936 RepID=UPI0015ACBCA3|nr:nuclear GTPase SLIP-GC-like isoform X3 [Anguilla anguilla]